MDTREFMRRIISRLLQLSKYPYFQKVSVADRAFKEVIASSDYGQHVCKPAHNIRDLPSALYVVGLSDFRVSWLGFRI